MNALKPALVIVAHGSQSPSWARSVQEFVRDVADSPGVSDVFAVVGAGYLENTQPSIADACEAYLKAGASELVVVPLFLTASSHQAEDVPAVLGLPGPQPHVRRRLQAEGVRLLPPGLPIKLAPIGDLADILTRNVSRRVALHSPSVDTPKERARSGVVLVAYGSTAHHEQWETLLGEVRGRLLRAGYGGAAHSYVGAVVQMSYQPTSNAIVSLDVAGIERIYVIPLLLSGSDLQKGPIRDACRDTADKLHRDGVELYYAEDAILPDGDLAARVAMRALQALGVVVPPGLGRRSRAGLA